MAGTNVQELIDRIMSDERFRSSSHFSDTVYGDEPILKTGRQMANYLPEEYRRMRSISRWQDGENGKPGRWLTEAELFYRQGMFMADFEDDCPYHGTFKSYYPTYNAMSDRQLRGYFTWRAQVRRGTVEETSTAFALVYLYELICGIGVESPRAGFDAIRAFWQVYRTFDTGIDRFARVWLQDYAVYHDLPAELLREEKSVRFDRALTELWRAADRAQQTRQRAGRTKRGTAVATLPLPVDASVEDPLFCAIDELSTYRIAHSALAEDHLDDLKHVACAVFIRMADYYDQHRKSGLLESCFGEETFMSYTMFASAVFFDPHRHPDSEYRLDDIHSYRCENGFWTCNRIHGNRSRSPKLGEIMQAVDDRLGLALDRMPAADHAAPPKYLIRIIDREIDMWLTWKDAHKPRTIDIDLTALGHIRSAAAQTCESLLIDEEREGGAAPAEPPLPSVAPEPTEPPLPQMPAPETGAVPGPKHERPAESVEKPSGAPGPHADEPESANAPGDTPAPADQPLDGRQTAFLQALLDEDPAAMAAACAKTSEDMLADEVNEALFDLIGDTVVEFGPEGPHIIEDYLEDVRGVLGHDR